VLILPVTALIETGNFIAHIPDGNARRKTAQTFEELLRLVIKIKLHGGFISSSGEPSF
jgi:hypothetical protein